MISHGIFLSHRELYDITENSLLNLQDAEVHRNFFFYLRGFLLISQGILDNKRISQERSGFLQAWGVGEGGGGNAFFLASLTYKVLFNVFYDCKL